MYLEQLKQDFNKEKIESLLEKSLDEYRKQIYLYVSHKCNLSCLHCYLSKEQERDSWDIDTISNYIYQLREIGYERIKITGGEPFIYPEFESLLRFINSCDFHEILIETNGTIVDENIIEKYLVNNNIMLSVSIDHYIADMHDNFRYKKGAFNKTIQFIQYVVNRNISTRVTTVLYKNNYKKINQIIEFIQSLKIKEHRIIFNIHPSGNALYNKGIELSLDECFEAMNLICQSEHFNSPHLILSLPPAFLSISRIQNFKACGWGNNVLGILPNGDLTMCYGKFSPTTPTAGNIKDVSLSELSELPYFQELQEKKSAPKGICGNCIYEILCQGMCKLSSYTHYHDFDAPYPFCQQAYNIGKFPVYAIKDTQKDSFYYTLNEKNRLTK